MLPAIGVLIAFVLIVALRLRNVVFSASILLGALVIGATSTGPVDVFVTAFWSTLYDPKTLNVSLAVGLITVLGYSLKETSLMSDLIEGLRAVLPSQLLLAIIPAMFGLLSMPGGALMSAPFNEPEADRLGLRPEQKTYVNVWFRHLWYWASPIHSTPILAASLGGFGIIEFLAAQLPMFFVTLAIGFVFTRGFIGRGARSYQGLRGSREVVLGLTPIVVTVLLSALGAPIWAALIVGVALVFIIKKVPAGRSILIVRDGVRWDIVASVVSMLFFRSVVIASGSVSALFESVTRLGIPLLSILLVVPLLVGAISGTPTMGMGIVFPILLALFGTSGVHLVSVIYVGTISGYLASPMHLCLVLTNSYYKSELRSVYRYLVPSAILLYVISVVYHLTMNGALIA
ncbi:MAG: DUF401 family protein [Candidatus Bathyarchaeota archaeon]|nr:MAG: DUF401 family protein [Candidatus Bathyarchaeota archaeon]